MDRAPRKAICLVVGLGNPGFEYQNHRHNAGIWFLDMLAKKHGLSFRNSSRSSSCRLFCDEGNAWLLKTEAYVNVSGPVVANFSGYYGVSASELLLVHDDIDLPVAKVRLKYGGGHGGHNGVRSVIRYCGSDFWRLRIGVGRPERKSLVHDYVLSPPLQHELSALEEQIWQIVNHVEDFFAGRFDKLQAILHRLASD